MKPYPYQLEGIDFLRSHSRAYLADEMGLGKTVQSLVAVADEDRVLVIAPAAALGNWRKEIVTWGNGQHFDVMSYADRRLRDGDVDGSTYGAVILDEAHPVRVRRREGVAPCHPAVWYAHAEQRHGAVDDVRRTVA